MPPYPSVAAALISGLSNELKNPQRSARPTLAPAMKILMDIIAADMKRLAPLAISLTERLRTINFKNEEELTRVVGECDKLVELLRTEYC